MTETILEAIEGIEPELGALKPNAPKSALIVSALSIDEIQKRYLALGERVTATKEKVKE